MRTNFYVAVYVWKWICFVQYVYHVHRIYVLPRTIDEYPEEYLMYSPLFSRRVSRGMLIAFWTIVGYHVGMRFSVGHVLPYIGNNFVRFQLAARLFLYFIILFISFIIRVWMKIQKSIFKRFIYVIYISFFLVEFKWKKEKSIIKFCLQHKISKYHHKLHEIYETYATYGEALPFNSSFIRNNGQLGLARKIQTNI